MIKTPDQKLLGGENGLLLMLYSTSLRDGRDADGDLEAQEMKQRSWMNAACLLVPSATFLILAKDHMSRMASQAPVVGGAFTSVSS